jgi:multidrug efflux pump subunit AcrA (membrane-fusion protein)
LNAASPIGTAGLKITFPSDIHAGDVWTVSVPHSTAPEYVKAKETYDTAVRTLTEKIANAKVQIANTETDIKQKSQSDTTPYRSLAINQAEAKVAAAKQQLTQHYDVVREQDIVAPFAGTVEGIENAVVGASPTGATNDSISLGTLISDDFLVQFTLNAIDVAKVQVGQKVIVNVTSFPGAD